MAQLIDQLYIPQSLERAITAYIEELRKSGSPQDLAHANLWEQYLTRMSDTAFFEEIIRLCNGFFDHLCHEYPQLIFSLEGRRKSVLSTENKILRYLNQGHPVDSIRDFIAFRIIVGDSPTSILDCYNVAKALIEYGLRRGFNPTTAPQRIDSEYQYIPDNPFHFTFPYKNNIKDYIAFPKRNGYKSIHVVLVDKYGRTVEFQIRTAEQHKVAEFGDADHISYKEQTQLIHYDPQKIQTYGYLYVDGFKDLGVIDTDGIEKPQVVYPQRSSQNSPDS